MDEFENTIVRGIHVSRYIASWLKTGCGIANGNNTLFASWLKRLVIDGEHLTDEERNRIIYFATNGKLELQENAKSFLRERGFN